MKRNKIVRRSLKLGFILICIMATIYVPCAKKALASKYEPAKAPKIISFTVTPANVALGETAILKWNVVNATNIQIKGLEKVPEDLLPLNGSLEVWPMATTTYVLIATGPGGTTSQSITLNVDSVGDAQIDYFKVSSTHIVLGDTIDLSWATKNVKSVSIIGLEKQDEASIPLSGTLEVYPTATTVYILQAVGFNGEVISKSLTVNVAPAKPAIINSFTASTSEITEGDNVTLTWDVSDAKSISITNEKNSLPEKGFLVVAPLNTTTYVLEAIGADGIVVSKSIEITVNPKPSAPKITLFTATDTTVEKGTLVTLNWTTENATSCMILTSDGLKLENRPVNGSISITPNITRTYTLIAYNNDKVMDEMCIKIIVN